MKKIILASLLIVSVFAVDAMAKKSKDSSKSSDKPVFSEEKGKKGPHDGKGPKKPAFENGCLSVSDAKGPMADVLSKGDTDGDGCVTEEEFKEFMKNNKPSGMPHKRPDEE